MQQYRLYFLDGLGHISKSREFDAADDAAAVAIAEGRREGRDMELWSGGRLVRVGRGIPLKAGSRPGRKVRNGSLSEAGGKRTLALHPSRAKM